MCNTLQNHSGAFRKNEEISAQTCHSDDFFDLKFSFSPCWRMCCPAGASRGKPGDSQKTYSRTSKMVGYFELSVPLSDHLLHESEKWDFWSRTPSEHLQIDLNILLHIWTKVQQPRTAVQQVFWHPAFDIQKMTKMTKNVKIMICPKFIQNRSQEVPGPSGHQKNKPGTLGKHIPEHRRW